MRNHDEIFQDACVNYLKAAFSNDEDSSAAFYKAVMILSAFFLAASAQKRDIVALNDMTSSLIKVAIEAIMSLREEAVETLHD